MTAATQDRKTWGLALGAFLLTLILFWPATGYDFVQVDDPDFVSANPQVRSGLTADGIGWAFTEFHAANWVPATFISLMIDTELFGTGPRGYHLVNIVLHALNAMLVVLVLKSATGRLWPSVFVALLFAVHPMRVESVAWIAERKDVLSTLFWLLSTWCWVAWTRRRGRRLYLLALAFFAIGLGAKGMLVTLPFTLLLLDVWPLRRENSWRERVVEKLPFFGLAFAVAALTFVAQRSGRAVTQIESLGIADRFGNALVSWVQYLGRLIWPVDLAYLYPHPSFVPPFEGWSAGAVLGAAGLLVALTALALVLAHRGEPLPMVGWFWYLGTLVPVIGIVQVGMQANADRYTYVPHLGLLWILCFGTAKLVERRPALRMPVVVAGVALVAVSAGWTRETLPHWQNSEAVYRRATEVTDDNGMAMNGLGATLGSMGRTEEALPLLEEAVRLLPGLAEARTNLGIVYMQKGQLNAAIEAHREAIRLRPDYAAAHVNLGNALAHAGEFQEAARHLQQGIVLDPQPWQPYYNLAGIRYQLGDAAEARRLLQSAMERAPDHATRMRIRQAIR